MWFKLLIIFQLQVVTVINIFSFTLIVTVIFIFQLLYAVYTDRD